MSTKLLDPGQVMTYAIDCLGYSESDFDDMSVSEFWESLTEEQKIEAIKFNS